MFLDRFPSVGMVSNVRHCIGHLDDGAAGAAVIDEVSQILCLGGLRASREPSFGS